MNWYLEVLKKYAVFTGRSRRKEYWYFSLFNCIVFLVFMAISGMSRSPNYEFSLSGLFALYCLAIFIPGLAVTVRRLHDIDHSGWWFVIAFVPLIGSIVLLVFTLTDSQPGANQYGPNPKAASLEGMTRP